MDINKIIEITQDKKLLYVEDDDILRMSTMDVLEDFFDDIYIAVDGKDGLETFKKNEIDIIITDLSMPNMGGMEMIKNIRQIDKNIIILVFSAHNELNIVDSINESNIQGYLFKPMDFHQFIDTISSVLS